MLDRLRRIVVVLLWLIAGALLYEAGNDFWWLHQVHANTVIQQAAQQMIQQVQQAQAAQRGQSEPVVTVPAAVPVPTPVRK